MAVKEKSFEKSSHRAVRDGSHVMLKPSEHFLQAGMFKLTN
jgi:hypothetical protein